MQPLEGYQLEREGSHAVALELALDDELRREGLAREVVHAVQGARKAAGLAVEDRIALALGGDDELLDAARAHEAYVGRRGARDVGRRSTARGDGDGRDHRGPRAAHRRRARLRDGSRATSRRLTRDRRPGRAGAAAPARGATPSPRTRRPARGREPARVEEPATSGSPSGSLRSSYADVARGRAPAAAPRGGAIGIDADGLARLRRRPRASACSSSARRARSPADRLGDAGRGCGARLRAGGADRHG